MELDKVKTGRAELVLTRGKIVFLDFILLFLAFFAVNYFRRDTLALPASYVDMLVLFYACWMAASLVGKKFQVGEYRDFWAGFRNIFKSNLYLGYCISFVIVFFGLSHFSRVQVFGTCLVLFLLNAGVWLVAHRWVVAEGDGVGEAAVEPRPGVDFPLLTADLGLLLASFWAVNFLKRGSLALLTDYDKLLLIMIGLWLFAALVTRKFEIADKNHVYDTLGQWVKAGMITLAGVGMVVFALRLFYYSRFQGFGTVGLLMALEVLLLVLVLGGRKARELAPDVETLEQVRQFIDQAPVNTAVDIEAIRERLMAPAGGQLRERLKAMGPDVFGFVAENVPTDEILWLETAVEQSCEPIGRNLADTPLRLFVNLHKLNDARRLNEYFLEMYRLLLAGGFFVGYAHTIRTHHEWVYGKFPRLMAHLVYGVSFAWQRVIPKLPWTKNVYFAVTKGKNRIISRAELLGRLSFCGFEIVAVKEVKRRFWVVARKVKMPSHSTNPTYGPIVRLPRSGFQGKSITVYKFRTMHPFSEFIQDYVFAQGGGLNKGDKFEDDFRITTWGRIFRKLWIDELPMLYNWLRGDLQLVGVRPLSNHKLGLYPPELQELRKRTKPGLVPPYYADLPEDLEELCASEKRYIEAFFQKPLQTQWRYFWKSFWNIVFKGARSS